jgi:serine protease Do
MTKITYLDEEIPRYKGKSPRGGLFVVIFLVLSLVMGLMGGTAALLLFSSNNFIKEKLGIKLEGININNTTTSKIVLEESSKVIEAVQKVTPAVVSITTSRNSTDFFGQIFEEEGGGTGFIITGDGLIITNKHVAQAGDSLKVFTSDGKNYDAEVVALDPTNDLAILKVEATGLPTVEIGDSTKLQIGQWVIAVGNALGEFQNSVTVGVISARERQLTATGATQTEQLNNLLQTDAAINPGNSGGPLVNLEGQVVGINTAIAGDAQNIGFAIPANQAKAAIVSYQKTGKIIKAQLGVRYVMINRQIAKQLDLATENGALVIARGGLPAVVSGGPADKAGFKSNDIITQINNQDINEAHPLGAIISNFSPGDEVTVKFLRDKKEQTVTVKLGSIE